MGADGCDEFVDFRGLVDDMQRHSVNGERYSADEIEAPEARRFVHRGLI